MSYRSDSLDKLSKIKSFTGVLKYLKSIQIVVTEINYRRHYWVFIGTDSNDTFVQISTEFGNQYVKACERSFNGENYDINEQMQDIKLTAHGIDKINDFLASKS